MERIMRRAAATLVTAALTASLCGCAVFEKVYFSAAEYQDSGGGGDVTGDTSVRNYFGLKLALTQLIAEHKEEVSLDLSDYSGDIEKDVASACKEAGTGTALGSYSVDYITYDLDRIIAYYEATVYINYKHSAQEVAEIISVDSEQGLYQSLEDALDQGRDYLAVQVAATGYGENDAIEFARRAYRNNPLCSAKEPVFDVTVYSGTGLQKIFEYSISYGSAEVEARTERLRDEVEALAETISAEGDAYRALQAAHLLLSFCQYDEDGGGTAWDAIIDGQANSEGMAMAFQALCAAAGVDSEVVSGRMNKVTHYWNIIATDGEHYHADVSMTALRGFASTFLCSDSDMWGGYWWDTEDYSPCEGLLDYSSLIQEKQIT